MYICPICSGLLDKDVSPHLLRGDNLYNPEDFLFQGCLCHYTLNMLESTFATFEERLKAQLTDKFPGCNMEEIRRELGKMERNMPLRIALTKKLRDLERARSRLLVLRKQHDAKKPEKEANQEIYDKAVKGEALSITDWIKNFTT